MLRIVRTRCHADGVAEELTQRGPFLTQAQVFDAGWKDIVVALNGTHLVVGEKGCPKRRWPIGYEELLDFARKSADKAKARLKAQEKAAAKRAAKGGGA